MAKAHSRTFYILTHFIQIYSTFVRQNPAESQSSDLIRKKVFWNKKNALKDFPFSWMCPPLERTMMFLGRIVKEISNVLLVCVSVLSSACPYLSPQCMYIVQHGLLYNKHKSRPRQIRVNLSFYIIQIWFMLLYYLNIYLFIFLWFLFRLSQ